jgi:hypothetical protein
VAGDAAQHSDDGVFLRELVAKVDVDVGQDEVEGVGTEHVTHDQVPCLFEVVEVHGVVDVLVGVHVGPAHSDLDLSHGDDPSRRR